MLADFYIVQIRTIYIFTKTLIHFILTNVFLNYTDCEESKGTVSKQRHNKCVNLLDSDMI